jgi:hypothetical protein
VRKLKRQINQPDLWNWSRLAANWSFRKLAVIKAILGSTKNGSPLRYIIPSAAAMIAASRAIIAENDASAFPLPAFSSENGVFLEHETQIQLALQEAIGAILKGGRGKEFFCVWDAGQKSWRLRTTADEIPQIIMVLTLDGLHVGGGMNLINMTSGEHISV